MMNRRWATGMMERKAARNQREDAAGRLRDICPTLQDLRIEIKEFRPGAGSADTEHIRRVVVEHAPALFELACTDSHCQEGGHDVTNEIVRALRTGHVHFEGEHVCQGHRGTTDCGRILRYVADATYTPAR